jgi:hypothetical protein
MGLRAEYDDPLKALVAGFGMFGFDDETIRSSVESVAPEGAAYETAEAYVRAHLDEVWGHPGKEYPAEELWEKVPQLAYDLFPTGFMLDWKWHTFRVATLAERELEHYGYATDVAFITEENATSKYPHLSTAHPEAFYVVLNDARTGEELERVSFRPPPAITDRDAVMNHYATAFAMNETLLRDRDVELVELVGYPGDHTKFAVVETERLDELEEAYGDGCPLFGQELVNRDFALDALAQYDPESASSHEDAFGVPEPDETFKLEDDTSLLERHREWKGTKEHQRRERERARQDSGTFTRVFDRLRELLG